MKNFISAAGAALCLTLCLPSAHAALGDKESAITNDKARLKAEVQVVSGVNYKAHHLTSPANTVREYVNDKGQVFAVTWSGIKRPDLQLLFGSHFSEYTKASDSLPKGKGRRNTRVVTPNMVVESGGHMRDIHGRAYLPAMVPAGVDPGDLP